MSFGSSHQHAARPTRVDELPTFLFIPLFEEALVILFERGHSFDVHLDRVELRTYVRYKAHSAHVTCATTCMTCTTGLILLTGVCTGVFYALTGIYEYIES